jgi:quercetin dioxygenase-like cupin family protein
MSLNPDDSLPNPKARSIAFPTDDRQRVQLLAGPPESRFLRSGYVKLLTGEAVGLHSTHEGEEVIIPISGQGELAIMGSTRLSLHPGLMAYIPPGTEHDVINTGDAALVYVYVVTRPELAAEG